MLGRTATGNRDDISSFHQTGLQSALTTQIKIYAADPDSHGTKKVVGAIQSFAPTETRALIRINEVGTDGVIEIVPQSPATVELTVTRMVFDYQRLPAAFQKGIRHIHAARLPFDIVVEDYNAYQEYGAPMVGGQSNTTKITTVYKNCWIGSYSFTYDQGNFLITENATISAEHVYDESSPTDNVSVLPVDTYESEANASNLANVLTDAQAAITR